MPTIVEAVETLVKLRDKKESIEAALKAKVKDVDIQIETVEKWIKTKLREDGVESSKTPFGTVFLSSQDMCSVADFTLLLDFIKSNDAFDMLNQSVSKNAVRDYLREHGELPPGVNWSTRQILKYRKPQVKA